MTTVHLTQEKENCKEDQLSGDEYGNFSMMGVGQLRLQDSRAIEHEPLLELEPTSILEVLVFSASFQ